MKYVKYILVLFFAYFICVLNVYAENSDYIYVKRYGQYFYSPVYTNDYHNYNFTSRQHLFVNNQFGAGVVLHTEALLNIANTYNVSGTLVLNMFTQPILVPTGGLDSCIYLAQNSNNERDALANCFNVTIDTSIPYTDLYIDIIPSVSTTWSTADNGDTQVNYSEGYQYTIKYSFNFRITEVNRDYDYTFYVNTRGGYLVMPQENDILSVLLTNPKINSVPFFTAENSYFATFFNNLNFDFHGLGSVVTAPISFVSSLSHNGTSALNITVFRKNISLPNGISLFWGRSDVATFRAFWNFFVGGAIVYLVYLRLFKYVRRIFDPYDSEVKTL